MLPPVFAASGGSGSGFRGNSGVVRRQGRRGREGGSYDRPAVPALSARIPSRPISLSISLMCRKLYCYLGMLLSSSTHTSILCQLPAGVPRAAAGHRRPRLSGGSSPRRRQGQRGCPSTAEATAVPARASSCADGASMPTEYFSCIV